MTQTIGNPLSWGARALGRASSHVGESVEAIGGKADRAPEVKILTRQDLRDALRLGMQDFTAARADALFLVVVYPVIGLVLLAMATDLAALPMLFPLVAGFALLGPLAAVGLYEISRRRERGEPVSWGAALGVIGAPYFVALVVLGLCLMAIFGTWLITAFAIHALTLGPQPPASLSAFLSDTFTTGAGWAMILLGTGAGFLFALLVLATSVISFPLLMDRHVSVPRAIMTSLDVFRKNPRVICTWGLIVAASFILGAIPALVGLVVVMPILGHATWHLYRRAVK